VDGGSITDSSGAISFGNENLTTTGTIEGATLTESSNAVPNATDNLSFFAATTSAQLLALLSDETGTGAAVFANTPTLVTPEIGAATGTSLDLGGTTAYSSRQVTVDTGGGLDINMGTASGDDFTVDTSAFVVEGDSGNVGIGTTSPTFTLGGGLHIAKADMANIKLQDTTTNSYYELSWADNGISSNFGFKIDPNNIASGNPYYSLQISGAEVMRVNSSGNVGIGVTDPDAKLEVNGDIHLTSAGDGIGFGSTAAANLLDDYEEGTWTPDFQGSTGSAGTSATNVVYAVYTKIGNIVHVSTYSQWTNIGSWTGDLRLTGLPFTAGTTIHSNMAISSAYNINPTTVVAVVESNGTHMEFMENNTTSELAVTDCTATCYFRVSGSYFVN